MEKPRIRHIAINVEDLDKTAEYYKKVFGMEEKHRRPGGTIYLSDGHLDLAHAPLLPRAAVEPYLASLHPVAVLQPPQGLEDRGEQPFRA